MLDERFLPQPDAAELDKPGRLGLDIWAVDVEMHAVLDGTNSSVGVMDQVCQL